MSGGTMLIALSLFSAVALSVAPAPSSEVARLRAHFDVVLDELARADTAHLDDAQRMKRAHHIEVLRAYAREGRFPLNEGHADGETPIFVDDHGTRCAMGHLIAESGEGALVDEIRATRNLAYVAELADDPRLHAWLDENGLTLREAGRIQPGYTTEEVVVAGLCRPTDWPISSTATQPDFGIVIVDVEVTAYVETFGDPFTGIPMDQVRGRVLDVVAVRAPCTGDPCASMHRSFEGLEIMLDVPRFAANEKRRAVVYVGNSSDGSFIAGGHYTFDVDGRYGDNADTDPLIVGAFVPVVDIPQAIMTKAHLAANSTDCFDILIAHDANGVCQWGTAPHYPTEAAVVAKQKCEAALLAQREPAHVTDEDVEHDETGLGPDDEPNGTPTGDGCEGTPSLALGVLAITLRRRRTEHTVRRVVRT